MRETDVKTSCYVSEARLWEAKNRKSKERTWPVPYIVIYIDNKSPAVLVIAIELLQLFRLWKLRSP